MQYHLWWTVESFLEVLVLIRSDILDPEWLRVELSGPMKCRRVDSSGHLREWGVNSSGHLTGWGVDSSGHLIGWGVDSSGQITGRWSGREVADENKFTVGKQYLFFFAHTWHETHPAIFYTLISLWTVQNSRPAKFLFKGDDFRHWVVFSSLIFGINNPHSFLLLYF